MSVDLLQKVSNRYMQAVIFHREQSDLFTTLSLSGFSALHSYQFIEETLTQRRLKIYQIRTYGECPIDYIPDGAGIIEPLLQNRNRLQITSEEQQAIIRKAFKSYSKWESETLQSYSEIGKLLFDNGDLSEYDFIREIISDVSEELKHINDLITQYESMSWDMGTIVEMQDTLEEKYIYKIREIYKQYPKYHHYNSK